jgi:hypothetical protein
MSEYQYYEFQAVDRPLTEEEMRELRAYSTRATITPTRFVNFYTWGDFKGNPSAWMEKYFDAFLYLANWGTHELMLRFPRRILDPATAGQYCRGDAASARAKGDFTVLEFHSDSEDGDDWDDDGSGWLSSLIPLRADIANGDHRALYLAWLLCAQNEELDDEVTEPPVPPGLGNLTAALQAFARFLRMDGDLIAAAAERSAQEEEAPARRELERWIAAIPEIDKDRFLVQVAVGEESHPRAELLRRFRHTHHTAPVHPAEPRTVADLLAAAARRTSDRRRKEAERAAKARIRREQEEAAARERRLDELAQREGEAWLRIDALVATKRPTAYDEAVRLLSDLRDLGVREGRATEVEARIQALRGEHARKTSFLHRLEKTGL